MRRSDAQRLLAAVDRPTQRPATLTEILALRKIVINLLYGQTADEPLDDERMREMIEAADSEKLAKALERVQAVTSAKGNSRHFAFVRETFRA